MNIRQKFNINTLGQGERKMMFAHGYGCDQNMWRLVAPHFAKDFEVILFDHVGAGGSDWSQYHPGKYSSLEAYADDIIAIADELEIKGMVFVGHSVSAMIGVIAAKKRPELFSKLILVGPSPRYLNDADDYIGGFSKDDIEGLMESLESNYLGWSSAMAPVIMGNSDRPELGEELTNSFCQMDPEIAKNFARVTFMSDNRSDLSKVKTPSLVLQCSEDVIAPIEVGQFVHANLTNSTLVVMKATGHCPNLSAPEETTEAIKAYLGAH